MNRVVQVLVVMVIRERRAREHKISLLRHVIQELDLPQLVVIALSLAGPLHKVARLYRYEDLAGVRRPAHTRRCRASCVVHTAARDSRGGDGHRRGRGTGRGENTHLLLVGVIRSTWREGVTFRSS